MREVNQYFVDMKTGKIVAQFTGCKTDSDVWSDLEKFEQVFSEEKLSIGDEKPQALIDFDQKDELAQR